MPVLMMIAVSFGCEPEDERGHHKGDHLNFVTG